MWDDLLRPPTAKGLPMTDTLSDEARPVESPEQDIFTPINQAILVAALAIVAILAIFAIRGLALRVTQYDVSVFEDYAREALTDQDFDRVIEICNGAMRAGVGTSEHHGVAYLLRAQGFAGRGELPAALADLDAAAVFSQESHYFMPEDARGEMVVAASKLAEERLDAGDAAGALRAFSAAAIGGGKPVEYLHALARNLPEASREALWGKERPWLVVRRFDVAAGGVIEKMDEEQGRTLIAAGVDGGSGYLELSPATGPGRSSYGDKLYLPLSEEDYALRVIARGEGGPLPDVLLAYWFDTARQSAHTVDTAWRDAGEGWQACDIRRDFYRERLQHATENSYSINDGYVSRISLEFAQDSATKVWLDRVELVLP